MQREGKERIMDSYSDMNLITCPHCNEEFEISQALSKQLEHQITLREREKHLKELEEAKKLAAEESNKKVAEQFELQLKLLKEDKEAANERNKQLLGEMSKTREELRHARKEQEEAMLQMQKKLAEEERKIRDEEAKKAEESQHSKLAEKEKQLQDAIKANEDLRRKLTQGSQQLQGEAFELEFEELLKRQYPNDKIEPVGKGIKGGDIIQEVWDRNGNYAGKIVWELKNTKTWSEPWVDKLKADKRAANGDEAVIISEVLPTTVKVAGFHNGVWVTQRGFVLPLADSLRVKLIQLCTVKNSLKGKDVKMEALYSYLTGTEFKNRIEAIVEAFSSMQTEVEKEKRYFANKWARDEKNIRQVIDSTYGMHGDLKGILAGVVPQIKGLEIYDGDDAQLQLLDGEK